MTSKEIKEMIIGNFINFYTDDGMRHRMNQVAQQYLQEDHVDEIKQAGWIDPKISGSNQITDVERKIAYMRSVIERNGPCVIANLPDWEEIPMSGKVTEEHVMIARVTYYGPECNNYIKETYLDSWDMQWDNCNDDEIDQVFKIISHFDSYTKVVALRKEITEYINKVINKSGEFNTGEIGAESIIYKELDSNQHLIERCMLDSVRIFTYIQDSETGWYDLKLTQLPLDILIDVNRLVQEYEDYCS